MSAQESRVGIGYDSHRFAAGRKFVLGGIDVPYEMGLVGHSDADALVHAVCDALLGAAGLGDIGEHFPDTDPRYKGISSIALLAATAKMLGEKGWRAGNIDAVVVCQEPRLAPYKEAMRRRIAEGAGILPERVSVKAKTNEGLDAVGKKEGIAVHAVALIVKEG